VTARNHQEVVQTLAGEVRRAAEAHQHPLDRIEALEGPIAAAVRDPYWLAAPFRRVQGQGTYYLLWRDVETDVSLIAMVLGPGDETPIHDHLTWGVVGVYEGEQIETRFLVRGTTLRETACRRRGPGSVSYLMPPREDIHFVRNDSQGLAISVFVMGSNLGCRSRHTYSAEGTPEEIVSGYANVPCPAQTRNPFFVSQFM
jgi:predicted metal-dependent enzyme (double-stranded beta helix superfamily)